MTGSAHESVGVVVVGGGQAGLAMGYYLGQRAQSFVILDAAPSIGYTWRTRYDSLRLFTPAQYNHLPGLAFPLPSDVYPSKDQVADYLERYARTFQLPVRSSTRVHALRAATRGYVVHTDAVTYTADQVVIATGPFQQLYIPAFAAALGSEVVQLHSAQYRNPAQLQPGSVLVVGAGNSGAQIAAELATTRQVYLAQGKRQPYLPQRFLGKDLFWWLHRVGIMGVPIDSCLGRRMQQADPIIGTPLRRLVRQHGLELVSRVVAASGRTVTLRDGQSLVPSNIIWATGFRPDYQWIDVPVFDAHGRPRHRRGITSAPGLYFLGLSWLYRRGSALLGGVGRDAAFLSAYMATAAWRPTLAATADHDR